MRVQNNLTLQAFRNPADTILWPLNQWDLLIRQTRQANLLASLYYRFEQCDLLDQIPEKPLFHLQSEKAEADALSESVRWEAHCIDVALAQLNVDVIFLKGAAYLLAGLPIKGRIFQDVDLLVPKENLAEVEKALIHKGWITTHLSAYDQRYFRQWMHEIPPLKHIKRSSVIDLHHNILPPTARLHPDAKKLIESAVRLDDSQQQYSLAPADMILHSATHLFHDGEFNNALRDLVDLDSLFRHFASSNENFWDELIPRAQQMDLQRPLFYALNYCQDLLLTPIPEDVMQQINAVARPNQLTNWVMKVLLKHAFVPDHSSCKGAFSGIALWCLYVRSHYLRMPFYLLIPHLVRKAFVKKDDV